MEKSRPGQGDFAKDRDIVGQSEFTLLDGDTYKGLLRNLIPQAKKRVWIQTMTFDGNGFFPKFKDLLNKAASKDVDTRFTVDMFYKRFIGDFILPNQLYLSRSTRGRERIVKAGKEEALDDLKKHNVKVIVTNPPPN